MKQLSIADARALLLRLADAKGVQLEVYAEQSFSTSIEAFAAEVSEFKLAKRSGLGLRVLLEGAWGYSYTENLSEAALERCFADALENASLVAPEGFATLAAHAEPPHIGDLYGEGLSGVGVERKVGVTLELERVARSADPRVVSVPYAVYSDGEHEISIANTAGLKRDYKSNYAVQHVMPLVSENGQNKSTFNWQFSREFETLDPTQTSLEAVRQSLALLGATMPASGTYPTVIENRTMGKLLASFSPLFSAKLVQEGKSPLAGKVDQTVGSALVTLRDDATRPGGFHSQPFDAEGFPSAALTLIQDGVLRGFLHNSETAAKAGTRSTGHASRYGYQGTVSVSPTNLYLEPGSASRDALLHGISAGVLLTELHGMHAGVNVVTGEFSLQADGFWIEDGAVTHALENFTVAGNFLELLRAIEALSNDLEFNPSSGAGAPSVRITALAIGGA